MSDEPTLNSINESLNSLSNAMTSFVSAQNVMNESQKGINETNTRTLEKLGDALSKSESMQVEINGINQKQTEQQHEISFISKEVSAVTTQVAVNKTLVDQTQDLKKMFSKAMIGVFFMFLVSLGSLVYSTYTKQQSNLEVASYLSELIKQSKATNNESNHSN